MPNINKIGHITKRTNKIITPKKSKPIATKNKTTLKDDYNYVLSNLEQKATQMDPDRYLQARAYLSHLSMGLNY